MAIEVQAAFRRYAEMIAAEVSKAPTSSFVPTAESDTALQVERAMIYAAALTGPPDDGLRLAPGVPAVVRGAAPSRVRAVGRGAARVVRSARGRVGRRPRRLR